MDDGYYKQRFDYMNLHGDVMFNLNALFGGYNQHRVYEIIPYVGAGSPTTTQSLIAKLCP